MARQLRPASSQPELLPYLSTIYLLTAILSISSSAFLLFKSCSSFVSKRLSISISSFMDPAKLPIDLYVSTIILSSLRIPEFKILIEESSPCYARENLSIVVLLFKKLPVYTMHSHRTGTKKRPDTKIWNDTKR